MTEVFVHASAVIDEGVEVGTGSYVWHFSHLSTGAKIGRRVSIGQNVYIAKGVEVGDGCKIQNNVSLYEGVSLEPDVFCGPSAVFTNVINPRAFVERKAEYKTTIVGRGASLGANCTIICGVRIGRYALVGAGAVVTADVPDFALVVGNPAVRKGWYSKAGARLSLPVSGSGTANCPLTGERYTLQENVCERLDK